MTNEDEEMITPEEAAEVAERSVTELGIITETSLAKALEEAITSAPVFVERKDKPGHGYYLVPWVTNESIVMIVEIDAVSGELTGYTPTPATMTTLIIDSERARRTVYEKLGSEVQGDPVLVWRPCRESSSPLRPFYEVNTIKGNVYVDMDGSVYTKLTPFEKGG